MPLLGNFRAWPPGAVPPGAGKWLLVAATIVVLLLIVIFGGPASAPRTSVATANLSTPPPNPNMSAQNERFAEQLRREQAELQRQFARERETRGVLDSRLAEAVDSTGGYPARESNPYAAPPPQTPVDPIEAERKKLELENFKREQRRAFASPLALSLRDGYERNEPAAAPQPAEQESQTKAPEPPPAGSEKFIIREGSFLETVLLNRLDSTFSGPVKVMVSNDLYARDRQTILIPRGTEVLGEANRVEATGQKRMAVVFHRLIRPDDVSVDLDRFTGLNQIGETGLRDKVNNHYLSIFGVSIALGVIGAAAQGTATYGYGAGGWDVARGGAGSGVSQAATQVLNRFLNIPPTVTIREGHRVKVYFMKDLEVPAYKRL